MPKRMPPRAALCLAIPGRRDYLLTHVALDFNGTLAVDGKLLPGIAARIRMLARRLTVVVLTGDTFGTATRSLRHLPVEILIVPTGKDKPRSLDARVWKTTVAIGNGCNDRAMLRTTKLGIMVLGPEGAVPGLLQSADIVVHDIRDALDLLLHPRRLTATLRK